MLHNIFSAGCKVAPAICNKENYTIYYFNTAGVYFKFSLLSLFVFTSFCSFFHFCLDAKVEQKIKPARLTPVGRGCIKKPKN
jgi:hypothetical protein